MVLGLHNTLKESGSRLGLGGIFTGSGLCLGLEGLVVFWIQTEKNPVAAVTQSDPLTFLELAH